MKIEEGTIISIKEQGTAEIKVGRHSDCIACGACEKRCPFEVSVIPTMKAAKALFGN